MADFLSPEWWNQAGKDVSDWVQETQDTIVNEVVWGDVAGGIIDAQDDISQAIYDFLNPDNPNPEDVIDAIENGPAPALPSPIDGPDFNGPAPELPFARTVVDTPTFSDPYVDIYEGTNDAEFFDVLTPYRNGKFDSPDKQAVVNANGGDDIVNGSDTVDIINGGRDDDALYGNAGNDWLTGGSGFDMISGGTGADVFEMAGAGHDVITDFSYTESDQVALYNFSGTALISEYFSENGTDVFITAYGDEGTAVMQLQGAVGAQVYDSIIGGENLELIATNFDPIDNPVLF